VYFSIFIGTSLSLPFRPEGTVTASSMGFPQAALTFLNQPAVVADARAGLGQMWEQASENGRGDFTKSCKWRFGRAFLEVPWPAAATARPPSPEDESGPPARFRTLTLRPLSKRRGVNFDREKRR
jgi:hypothetical protein